MGSGKRHSISGAGFIGLRGVNAQEQGSVSGLSHKTGDQYRDRYFKFIVFSNCVENIILFLMLLNSVIYPNASTAIYYLITLALTGISLSKDKKKIQLKYGLSIAALIITLLILIGKGVTLILLNHEDEITLTSDERLLYDSLGIRIDQTMKKIKVYNTFMTLFFDCVQVFFSIILVVVIYNWQLSDCKLFQEQRIHQNILNPIIFSKHYETLCFIALVSLAVSTIFIQTIVQTFILCVLIVIVYAWANDTLDRNDLRITTLNFAQGLTLLQLTITFVLQIAFVNYELVPYESSMIWDMFGFFLHNLHLYQVILHLVALSFSIQAIQLFRTTRSSFLKDQAILGAAGADPAVPMVLGGGGDTEKRSERIQFTTKRFGTSERGKTMGSGGGFRSTARKSLAVERFREKNIEAQMRKGDESSIFQYAQQINYKDYSPQIILMVCRIVAFIWCYAYHDFQSWILLGWIMHSTVFVSMKKFFAQTVNYYLPVFLVTFIFYYVINIPRVIEFGSIKSQFDTYLSLGLYEFKIPPVEVTFFMLSLLPFFFLIKSRKYLRFNREEQKQRFLEKLSRKESPTLFYMLFLFITNLDMIVFIAIFFSGVNKIDFYHIFLMFFFVAYIVAPVWFKKNYIYLLYYVNFFVFEKYLYTLVDHLFPPNSTIQQLLDVMGLSTDYNEKSDKQYFRYIPKPQQWMLIVVVFLQHQVHKLTHDEKLVEQFSGEVSGNFKLRYPRMYHFWELLQHIKKECLILLTFIVFFVIIIFSDKNIINWGFQIIICIFIITYVGVSHTAHDNGIIRLQNVWPMIIWYSSFVLIVQITFQFAALPFVRKSLHLDYILNLLPLWIRQNLRLIGFQIYTDYIWEKFIVYLMYFSIGIYVKDQMIHWKMAENNSKFIELKQNEGQIQMNNISRGSDNQPYFPASDMIDYQKEFLKIRFTTPYLVYKLRRLWFIIDKCSQLIFVFISLMIMILATQWQISLSMAVHLTCFIGLCLQIATVLYQHRKIDKHKLKNNRIGEGKEKYKKELTITQCESIWRDYKLSVNKQQVKIRQKVWFFQFVVTLLCIALIYPSEFIFYVRKTFFEQGDQEELVALLDYITFYLFWVGVYHCPKAVSGHGYFYNLYGYLIILLLLVFEKNAQKWALDRFGCTAEKEKNFKEIEENLEKKERKPVAPDIPNQIILEAENEDEGNSELGQSKQFNQKSGQYEESYSRSAQLKHSQSIVSEYVNDQREFKSVVNEEELKAELKKWIQKKYMLKILSGFKILLEETIQLLLLISSVYKDSVVGLVLLAGVFLFMIVRKTKTIARLAWITGTCMVVQYGLALSNLTTDNNPMDFPFPFNPYPPTPQDEGEFFIPWYRKIPLLADSFPWQIYLSMGVSNVKVNTIWIDYIIMGCIQASLFYFGCQLFSLELKVLKGDDISDYSKRYVEIVSGKQADNQTIKKEIKKLKRQVPIYSFYKASQILVFMHFHQITIVVTLMLSILARSLVSFGYILVCMVMIYENHKYFTPNQKNFKLKEVLKYFLQPYVIIDITLQLIFQIPIEWLHEGQDEPSSWQNIIGLQDIWTEDATQVNEVTAKSITYIILKALTFYFVTLQIQIFDSAAYEKYRGENKDFQKFLKMAKMKGQAVMWRLNNEKIDKIKQQQQEKSKMDKMLINLKKVLTKWSTHNLDVEKRMQVIFELQDSSIRDSVAIKKPNKHAYTKRESTLDYDTNRDELPVIQFENEREFQRYHTNNSQKNRKRRGSFQKQTSFRDNNRSSTVSSMFEDQELFIDKDEKILLETMKAKLNVFVRLYIWIKKVATDQVIFISSKNYLSKVSIDMQRGQINIFTKMERKMLSDIRDFKKKTIFSQQEISLQDMKRTMQLIKFGRVLQAYFRLIIEILISYSDSVCYILMLVSMMKNAGLISILYPFFVFGYAIFEEINPKKVSWYRLMIYTEIMIMAKFIVQLSFWDALLTQNQLINIQDTMNGIHLGLIRVDSDAFAKMVSYFLPEILILLAIMAHIQKQIMMGSLDFKDKNDEENTDLIEVEGIEDALQRYVKNNELQAIKETNKTRRGSIVCAHDYPQIELDGKEELIVTPDGKKRNRAVSLVDQQDLKRIYEIVYQQEMVEKIMNDQLLQKGFLGKSQALFSRIFFKNSYFEKLFPSIKEQKPGKDLYALMATLQFIICLFMIFFYTKMDADVTNISDVLQYNQFSGQMVIALFLQILVMIIDRYLYKSKTFINQEQVEPISKGNQKESIAEHALQSIQVQKEKEGIKFMLGKMKSNEKNKEVVEEKQVMLENTKVTIAMVSKYYLQFTLLIIVHGFVFWYFPIMGNIKLQNYPYCVTKTAFKKDNAVINCNEFGDNWALVIFYILYCGYFWVSSLQIKYGVSEIKKGNFLMNSYHIVNYVCFKGFMAIPFLFELKTFADWTFTKTALDVFQWFILSATHAELYIAHSLQGRYQRKPLGKPIQLILKIILGFFGQLFIILLIAGPLLLFSTFNPISTPNPVIDAQIQFNILIEPQNSQARNTINLFTNNYVSTIKTVTTEQYNIMGFQNDPKTKSFDQDLIQFVKMNNFPDTKWDVSFPNRGSLKQEFQRAVNNQSTSNLYFQLAYIFDRHSSSIPQAHNPQKYFNLSNPIYRPALVNFSKAFSLDCTTNVNQTINIPEFFTGVLFLNDDEIATPATNNIWKKGLQVTYSCKDYWTVDQQLNQSKPEANLPSSKNPGIAFFTFSSKTAPSYFKYSVLTFYLSIVLVIGKLIRGILVIGGNRIFIFEIPRAEPLLQLCECVHIYRMKQQLDKEEQLYFTFVDIMRSPEMIKAITGSSMKKKTQ